MKQAISHYQENICVEQCAAAAESTFGVWANLIDTLKAWSRRARTRRQLSRLTEAELDDVGISVTQAQREIDKPFWLK